MRSKLNVFILFMFLFIISISSVQANFLTDIFNGGVDMTEYDECLLYNTQTECATEYCNGNGKGDKIYCNYESDANRLFDAEMYPMTCDELNRWNTTEEIRFTFGVNVDSQDYSLNTRICQGDDTFDQFYKKDSYRVPYEVLNGVQSYETMWIDLFGAIYLERPSKSELETIYGNVLPEYDGIAQYGRSDVEYIYESIEEVPINDQTFSILGCSVDCDYQGENDNNLNAPISTNGKKGGLSYDYTRKTTFLNIAESEDWAEHQDLTFEDSCNFWENIISNFECTNNFIDNINLQNYYKTIDRLEADIDYSYWYSNTNNVLNSFTCDYPKEDYADTDITARVRCQIGKTWEGIFFSPDTDSIKFDTIGINNDRNAVSAYLDMDVNFHLNGTSGEITNNGGNITTGEQTIDEYVDDEGERIGGALDYLIKYDENIKDFIYSGPVEEKVYLQEEVKSVLDGMTELNTYIFSFILLIAYFVETFIFIGVFKLIISSFSAVRKAFKDLFGINQGGNN